MLAVCAAATASARTTSAATAVSERCSAAQTMHLPLQRTRVRNPLMHVPSRGGNLGEGAAEAEEEEEEEQDGEEEQDEEGQDDGELGHLPRPEGANDDSDAENESSDDESAGGESDDE